MQTLAPAVLSSPAAAYSTEKVDLKEVLKERIVAHQKKVTEFRKEHADTVIQQTTIDMAYGGMRSMKALVCETSVLDADEGIRFRGYSIPECQKVLPKAPGGREPLPESIWWLLCTGDVPTQAQVLYPSALTCLCTCLVVAQVNAISKEWAARADIPGHVAVMLDNFPPHLHPMSQFIAAIAALNTESKFAQAYAQGTLKKAVYWEVNEVAIVYTPRTCIRSV